VGPSAANQLKTCVVSIQADANKVPQIKWSRSRHSPTNCPTSGQIAVPANLIAANEGLVMSEVQYVYTSNIADFLPSPITFKERFYLKPRQSTYVKLENYAELRSRRREHHPHMRGGCSSLRSGQRLVRRLQRILGRGRVALGR